MKRTAVFLCIALLFAGAGMLNAQQNLKVYISVDMEGICGVVNSDHVSTTGSDYGRAREWMTEEANAAILGALDAGATEIVVNDSHGGMRNILIEKLHPEADLISGSPKALSMMEGIDETYDAVIFIGYHARMGTMNAILDHTMSSSRIYNVFMNGKIMNEASMNAAIAGYYGVPVVFVAGDKAVTEQVHELIGKNIEVAAVKEGVGRQAARNVSLERARKMIREGVRRGIENRQRMPVYKLDSPVTLEMEFLRSDMTDNLILIPGVKRISARKVTYTHDDYIAVFKLMRALIILAGS